LGQGLAWCIGIVILVFGLLFGISIGPGILVLLYILGLGLVIGIVGLGIVGIVAIVAIDFVLGGGLCGLLRHGSRVFVYIV
jgi:hypothetical protein